MLGIVNPNVVSIKAIRKNFKDDHRNLKGQHDQKCDYCGQSHRRGKRKCPAYGKECDKCGQKNYFKTVCRSSEGSKHQEGQIGPREKIATHRCNVHEICMK